MAKRSARTPVGTVSFRLGVLGAGQEARYAERLADLELKPKHVALLSALRIKGAESQLEVAAVMRVAPSLVVLLADQLEARGAIERVRDPSDRRRQRLHLTEEGVRLLDAATAAAAALDEELTAPLDAADRAALARILERLAIANDLLAEDI
ncbi:DNA-binding MarR family transcriptional regulator [Thermocatellispora tengchongensis]|uniref:DNA-binding MarR family transcriptional regulator n=1 Tax=Thermocatellispora tengchongensis TaxID=1073253 RepID=A0A840P0V4_9ACTN|nr:MarR family transcriptional regulator [Thermocatellispora tengchongensis]MBB5131090.1 DNA-binding MarR family transcriptional regulator [Thermocatellispora tengchongensis]